MLRDVRSKDYSVAVRWVISPRDLEEQAMELSRCEVCTVEDPDLMLPVVGPKRTSRGFRVLSALRVAMSK